MSEMVTYICKTCGGKSERVGNRCVCQYCGNSWEIDSSNDIHAVQRANAWAALRDGDFEKSEGLFDEIILKEPDNYEAYWGKALSLAHITYVTDLNENKKVPTCNNITENSFSNEKNVERAISLAPEDISESYKRQAAYIDKVRLEWLEKASREPAYDVFISFKDSDRESGVERTQDSVDAQDLYNALTAEGYKVFFSRVSLRNKVAEQYEPYIYNAIKTAKVMIVFGEKPEYFNSVWVKNEWGRFRSRLENGEKHKNSLVVVYKNCDPGDLPAALRSRQCLNASDMTFLSDLLRHIKRITDETQNGRGGSNPVAVPAMSGANLSREARSQVEQGQYPESVRFGGSSSVNVSKRNVKGFSHKLKIAGVVSLILIILAVAGTLFVDPVIYAKMPEKEITVEYGASIEELELDVYLVSILNKKTSYDVTSDMVTGYDETKMGIQEISINCNGKVATLRVNMVARSLRAPTLSMKDGLICFNPEPYAENIILCVDGTEIAILNTSAIVLPEEVPVGTHDVKIKFVNSNENIVDSEYSDSIQIERKTGTVTIVAGDGKIVWEKQGSSGYNIVVDGKFFRTVSGSELALNEIGTSGKHTVNVCIAGDNLSTVSSAPSNTVEFVLLPAAVGLQDNETNFSWEKVDGVDGYDIYVNGAKRLNVGADICSVDWMKLYAEGGSTAQVVSVGNGKTTISSALSEAIKHTYSQSFKTISSASDLKKLEGSNESFILTNDIDMSQVTNWKSISSFSGKLYGNDHSILNYTVKKTLKADDAAVGLIARLNSGALITGITFENVNVDVTGGERYCVGVIADASYGMISDCIIKSGTVSAGNCYLGAICGYLGRSEETGAKISNCKNYADVIGQGLEDYGSTGGICGVLWLAKVVDSDNYGTVSGRDDVGGIFGYGSYTGSVSSGNTNYGQVAGKKYIGGIVGRLGGDVQFEACENNGNVGDVGSEFVGGIIGKASLSGDYRMSGNSNKGNIVGTNNIGGIIGYLRGYRYTTDYKNFTLTFVDLTNIGTINASGNNCGGIVGYIYARSIYNIYNLSSEEKIATITMDYVENSGDVSGANSVGGIVGYGWSSSISNSTISNSKNSGNINGNLNVGSIIGENTNIRVQ